MPFDFAALRGELAGQTGKTYWRSLESLARRPEVQHLLEAEFPGAAPLLDRRRFLQLMGASLTMAGLSACGETPEQAVPYVEQPENLIPGKALWYASAVPFAGYAQPILGKTHAGRPTKLEGNPEHPAAAGACDAFTQAAILQLYDPDRSQAPRYKGRESNWAAFHRAMANHLPRLDAVQGRGLHLLCGASSSPTLQRQLDALRRRWPEARLYHGEAFAETPRYAASRAAFGRALDTRLRLENAEVLLCLDDDLLGPGPRQTLHQRGWAQRRRAAATGQGEASLFVVEALPSLTGAAARDRLRLAPSQWPDLALALAQALGEPLAGEPRLDPAQRAWIAQVAGRLAAHPGRGLISAGTGTPEAVQALAHRLNQRLGNVGHSLDYAEPLLLGHAGEQPWESLQSLTRRMQRGEVESLLLLDCNPVYGAPDELDFSAALQRVPLRLHAGLYYDESAAHCHWHLPMSHALDSWSDARAVDGSPCIQQPLVRPLYSARSLHQILAACLGDGEADGLSLVRETWREQDDAAWRAGVARGFLGGAAPALQVASAAPVALAPSAAAQALELQIRPDPCIWDGRFANLGWLQELPKPISKLTWDNVVGVSPALAARYGLANGDLLEVSLDGRRLRGPAWIEPGQVDEVIALYAGYGRSRAGRVGNRLGYRAATLLDAAGRGERQGARLAPTGERTLLASTQTHHLLDSASPIRSLSRAEAAAAAPPAEEPPTLYRSAAPVGPQWGLLIDLDLCTGCNACVTACQAENNIAVVGKEQVAAGRAMHWLRVDHYYEGTPEAPRSAFQPVPCMHCEQAPCETGCPVSATVHGPDGLNEMVYNRCIGTRTCSSFCPYKVRRFNWYDWNAKDLPAQQAQRNPNVSVRGRGVMEKCTYCIQRISEARIEAEKADRPLADGEVRTACQQTCPAEAIRFGDIADRASAISRARDSVRHYALLEELNTRPRTTYLARLDEGSEAGEDA
ncbi:TAT-variant-translocated molybdopterin oxidoreductase [Pseudomonas sp. RIT-PI-AD]|uniref:TAT-variant-translocated molybdopterin oxidoreductase n=1 Tax=Pseudomonas sp. RIT-PI-AD TaxID=3035294 RepID=UPI0021DB40EA|nr:TAT-variant-translocated molybdopterin oxidoreductase [Pseudomonas sp. RIT-PI-AD]